jgi:hypothetical protein
MNISYIFIIFFVLRERNFPKILILYKIIHLIFLLIGLLLFNLVKIIDIYGLMAFIIIFIIIIITITITVFLALYDIYSHSI